MEVLTKNKKAYFNYQIMETFEAGIVLKGSEVKSIRAGRINLAGSYATLKGDEAFLIGADISPWQQKNTPPEYDSKRSRKLLLNKAELRYLIGKAEQKNLTLVPLRMYSKRGKIKLEFGLARGRKKANKRELLKKRTIDKEIKLELKLRG